MLGSWMSPSPTTRTGTHTARQSEPGQQLRPLVTSHVQPCHGHVSCWPFRTPLASGPPLCGQLLSRACKVPSMFASAYWRSPATTRRTWPSATSPSRATVTYSTISGLHREALDRLGDLRLAGGVELLDVAR